MNRIAAWVPLLIVLVFLMGWLRFMIGTHNRQHELHQAVEVYRAKLQPAALKGQLRGDNAFGHARDARLLDCVYNQAPASHTQRWDYICFLYWGTQPGAKPTNQMKFGVMVDSSHVTRLSALVPAQSPDPPLDAPR